MIIVNLKYYLEGLKAKESLKDNDARKEVPNITQLAKKVGWSRASMTNFCSNKPPLLNKAVSSKIIDVMRNMGFDMKITDLFAYHDMRNNHTSEETNE